MVLAVNQTGDRVRRSAQDGAAARDQRLSFRAMGTLCQIVFNSPACATADTFTRAVLRWVSDFEAKYSRFLPNSLVGRVNERAGTGWTEIDAETQQLLALCQEVFTLSRGAFDPTVLPLIELWNWKADPPGIPSPAAIRGTLDLVGWHKVQRRPGAIFLPQPGMRLDLGGIGKEYAVDRVVQLAQAHEIQDGLVDFGQDIRVFGAPPDKPAWHIGLEDPTHPGRCWTGVAVKDLAVATSGDYLRKFEINGKRYGHILDPRTGYPVDNGCRAVSVIAPSCTIAGVLATTGFILGPCEGLRFIECYLGAEGCILTDTKRYETRRFNQYVTH